MKSKKGIELTMSTIIVAIIVLIVLVVSIMVYTKYIGKSASELDKQIGLMDDYDKDGTLNMFDKCPCDDTDSCGCIKGEKDSCKKDRSCLEK